MLEIGAKAPEFELEDQNGKVHRLEDYRGKKVILYFYPKDNTPGCSMQAVGFSELKAEYEDKNAVVLGVSKDSVKSHKNFETKKDLKITILSDPELKTIKDYDVWKEKTIFGKTALGIVRTTYVIDEEGTIIFANGKVKAKADPKNMLEEI
ncbi:peroxiredoxin Q/BCP [Peptoniphilus asaccharolyticus DSM 20463]|uniref:thioredoxin-dependent peroxiredoxin n=1 Tax=Peptoniphilus asaccharolyticus DSM 20463 TaxID=573058 RepID=A0A1W1V732_PEPAS|nr:peroxiredoxin [Peptoniphilus asaccharolyticus]MBL7575993.1 peroxiredoxin [Peptoniphilus asaccharolyticus]MBL7576007.1 peroxiredoxin [Peptoniphilus asaccharolyticus]MBL7576406.1 peroxiredoxin [Peptoniphilus asaccharolyticus]SMB88814.1 peroxiredoxin Q/BCP [Peptoniphilus asaccharolyticus DSM 20463]